MSQVLLLFFFQTNGQSDNKINVEISPENNLVKGKHLFILSGQSNMVGLIPEESFTPIIEKKYGKEKIIIVKDAKGGQPIRRWYKEWEFDNNNLSDSIGNLYNSLIYKVRKAVKIFNFIHSLDNHKLADICKKSESDFNRKISYFIQVNIGNELQKSGVQAQELDNFYTEVKKIIK